MKNIRTAIDKSSNRISYYLIALFLVSLPFDRFYSQLALICLFLHSIIFASRKSINLQTLKTFAITTSLYFVTIICTLYTSDIGGAFDEWEKQLAILLFPAIFLINPLNTTLYKKKLLMFFAVSCSLAVLYLYITSFSIIQYNKLPYTAIYSKAFINHNFSNAIGTHATYLSIYLLISFVFCLEEMFNAIKSYYRVLLLALLIILAFGLLQLSSKSVLISGFFIISFFFPFIRLAGKKRTYYMLSACFLSLFAVFLIIKIDSFNTRFTIDLKNDLVQSSERNESIEPRIVRWRHVFKLIKKAPLFGHGTGSERKLLNEEYYKNGLYNSFLNNLNAHNQYLSLWLKTGVAGLLLYLLILFSGLRMALSKKDFVFLTFMILIIVVSFTENILDVNKGIFLFAFFLSFFLFLHRRTVTKSSIA